MSIKVERKLHDMRMLGRIVSVQGTEQSVGITKDCEDKKRPDGDLIINLL